MTVQTEARNATLADLGDLLRAQHVEKTDMVVPASMLRSTGGNIVITQDSGIEGLGELNVGTYRPTQIMDGHIADKLGIPVKYVRRMRDERPDLYDANVNGWLHGDRSHLPAEGETLVGTDPRSFLFRGFNGGGDDEGIGRALLSDTYKPIDNLDVLIACLSAIKESGIEAEVVSANLTETRMSVQFAAPAIAMLVPELLQTYRSPLPGWESRTGNLTAEALAHGLYPRGQEPVLFAGFELNNSETGGGAFVLTPRFTVALCRNGWKLTGDAMRTIHLGGKLEAGQVRWSDDTQRKNVELVMAKTKDAVTTFMDIEYMKTKVAEMGEKAGKTLTQPGKVLEVVSKELKFTEAETAGILDFFISSGQPTPGGVLQAVTAYAQTVANADQAHDLENVAMKAMDLAAAA